MSGILLPKIKAGPVVLKIGPVILKIGPVVLMISMP